MYYYNAEGKGYQVNSEMVSSNEYDIAVYASDVVVVGEQTQVTNPERAEVITRVKKLCDQGNVKIRIFE
ncbi:MAG: hypothetical protein ABIY63_18155 [Fibrobacteria bacterium]